jgi:acylphosphatase
LPVSFDYGIYTAVQYQVVENNTSLTTGDTRSQTSELQTLRAVVHGRVQNVGFRMFVLDAARGLGLAGYVRNEYDGSVSVTAVGATDRLERLLTDLRRGPSQARVERVDVQWQAGNPSGLNGTFEVRY